MPDNRRCRHTSTGSPTAQPPQRRPNINWSLLSVLVLETELLYEYEYLGYWTEQPVGICDEGLLDSCVRFRGCSDGSVHCSQSGDNREPRQMALCCVDRMIVHHAKSSRGANKPLRVQSHRVKTGLHSLTSCAPPLTRTTYAHGFLCYRMNRAAFAVRRM